MKYLHTIALFLLAFSVAFSRSELDRSIVYELTPENFNRTVTEFPFVVVEFYAPWCGACRKFESIYENLAQKLHDVALFTRFDAVEESHKSFVSQYSVNGYPTIYFFKDGVPEEYFEDVFKSDFDEVIRKKSKPTCRTITDERDFGLTTETDRVVIIGFFTDENSDAKSKDTRKMTFAAVLRNKMNSKDFDALEKEYSIQSYPFVVLFKAFDEGKVELRSENFASLEEFILMHECPLLANINKENSKTYINTGVPILFFFYQTEAQKTQWSPVLTEIAKDFRGKIHFVFIDFNEYGNQANKLGLSGNVTPAASIENTIKKLHYPFDEKEELTEANLRSWITAYTSGTLRPKYRSQPAPTPNNSSFVLELVGDTLNETVLNGDKDVFVEIYAPWCGHCKALAPVWEKLAQELRNESVVIAKLDGTANVIQPPFDDIKITMYPTLIYFKKSDIYHPVHYQRKERDIDTLKEFVKENRIPTNETSKDQVNVEKMQKEEL